MAEKQKASEVSGISAERVGIPTKEWEEYTPEEQEAILRSQVVDDPDTLMEHQLPPELRVNAGKTVFSEEDAIRMGLSDAEIVKLRQSGAMHTSGLLEYDEEAEVERLHRLRMQHQRGQNIDGGDLFAVQIGAMERYFRGLEKNSKTGKFCQRQMYTSPKDEVVGINGYIFNIPKFRPVPLPTEVIDILEQSALATNRHDIYSAIMQARANRTITLEEYYNSPPPENHLERFAASHPVRQHGDLRPFDNSVSAFTNPRGF